MIKIRPTPCGKTFLILLFAVTVAVCLLYLLTSYHSDSVLVKHKKKALNSQFSQYVRKKAAPFIGEKIIHLDLKGAPPKVSYYKDLFPLLSKMGATGLLMEYEDMFPFSGKLLENITALNAYSLNDIKLINKYANQSNLKVMPLVQTFGHMEFILKLPEFKDFREVETYPSAICPSHKKVINLLSDMIEQVVNAHPESNMIHIGSDEVYYLGICDKCRNVMTAENLSKYMLFIRHVNLVVKSINDKYPNLRILMWDDEFRSVSKNEFKKNILNKSIEPVVWKYTKDVIDDLGPSLWHLYSEMFPKIWVASAFKGATGSNQYVVDVPHYLQNHRSWMELMSYYKNQANFVGIIITGWQRYDHFAVLCELLPVGLPSLAMSMRIILGYTDSPLTPPVEVAEMLQCEQPYALIGSAFGTPRCSFPGGNILENVLRLHQLKQEFESILVESKTLGWMDEYNMAHAFSSPQYIESITSSLNKVKVDLASVDADIIIAMQDVYDNYTIDEWRETYIKSIESKVNKMWEAGQMLLSKDNWPRRPLSSNDEL